MPFRGLGIGKVAQITGVHPNTIRMYEKWGYLSPVERTPAGYRIFTPLHIEQVKLVRLVYGGLWPGRAIRQAGAAIIHAVAAENFARGRCLAQEHLAVIHSEQAQAEAAVEVLQYWAASASIPSFSPGLRIGEAAALLRVSVDMLRNWERSGLLCVPRLAGNRYRQYGESEIARARVIRLLLKSGYSMMAVLRMLLQLERGETRDLRAALDTPRPDEDAVMAADRWLSALADVEQRARAIVQLLERL